LPPILDNEHQTSTQSCSKGSRGLSVQPRVLGIFTETTISPDPSLRQRPSRYAIRAGRNLPDKEFRFDLTQKRILSGIDASLDVISLHVAMQQGPYLHPVSWTSGVWSLRILTSSCLGLRRFIVSVMPAISINPSWERCRPASTIRTHRTNCSKSWCLAVTKGYRSKNGITTSSRSVRRRTTYRNRCSR